MKNPVSKDANINHSYQKARIKKYLAEGFQSNSKHTQNYIFVSFYNIPKFSDRLVVKRHKHLYGYRV